MSRPWDAPQAPGHPLPRGGRMALRSLADAPDATSWLLAAAARAGRRSLLLAEEVALAAADIGAQVDALAAGLLAAGLAPGDVAILPGVQKTAAWLAMLACWRAGIIAAPLNPASTATARGLRRLARRRVVRLALPDCPPVSVADAPIVTPAPAPGRRADAILREIGPFDADWPALILHSSGTTGRPKRILHDHGALVATARIMGAQLLAGARVRRIAGTASLGFAYGLGMLLLAPLATGVTVALAGERHLAELPGWWEQAGVDSLASVPTGYRRLLAEGGGPAMARLRVLFTAGEPLDEPTRRALLATGARLHDVLGASETLSAFAASGPEGRALYPLDGIAIAIRTGRRIRALAAGVCGELLVRGPTTGRMATAADRRRAAWRDWLRARDLVEADPGGGFRVLGRSDDIIVARGVNIAPQEIEAALGDTAGVAAVAVAGLEDARRGARLVGVVVPAPEAAGSTGALLAALDDAAARNLPAWKRPQGWIVVAELPVTVTGKLRRRALRELVAARAAEIVPAAS